MYWSFATINNRLGEIYFHKVGQGDKSKVVFEGHCYVKRSDFKTKVEGQALDKETAKYHISYRNKKYRMPY